MKLLRKLLVFLAYILYVPLTLGARDKYIAGKAKGMHCYRADMDAMGTTYHFSTEEPYKEYLTFKEFWNKYYKRMPSE